MFHTFVITQPYDHSSPDMNIKMKKKTCILVHPLPNPGEDAKTLLNAQVTSHRQQSPVSVNQAHCVIIKEKTVSRFCFCLFRGRYKNVNPQGLRSRSCTSFLNVWMLITCRMAGNQITAKTKHHKLFCFLCCFFLCVCFLFFGPIISSTETFVLWWLFPILIRSQRMLCWSNWDWLQREPQLHPQRSSLPNVDLPVASWAHPNTRKLPRCRVGGPQPVS